MEGRFDTYYWQNELVRLRLWQPKDTTSAFDDEYDSDAWALVHEEVTLPPMIKSVDKDGDSAEPKPEAPSFTIESLAGEYIGHIHFNYINERHGTFSIGMIITRAQRGKGYGKAAMQMLLEYAFNERRLHKFSGFCLDTNVASAKMMESLGCIREGVNREIAFIGGKYHDQYLYGLTASEYNQKSEKFTLLQ